MQSTAESYTVLVIDVTRSYCTAKMILDVDCGLLCVLRWIKCASFVVEFLLPTLVPSLPWRYVSTSRQLDFYTSVTKGISLLLPPPFLLGNPSSLHATFHSYAGSYRYVFKYPQHVDRIAWRNRSDSQPSNSSSPLMHKIQLINENYLQ